MQEIQERKPLSLIESELTPARFMRKTTAMNNDIFIFTGNDAPYLMEEVGRIREIAFRLAGGGTGKPLDIDEFDTGKYAYSQLIVWDPDEKEIIGGYRFKPCWEAKDEKGHYHLSTTEIFHFSKKLKEVYFPYTIELGRSFVQPMYQASKNPRKGIYALDNLWDGLGSLVSRYPIKYFFGKITMYTQFNQHARNLILSFMHHYFPDKESLLEIPNRLHINTDVSEFLTLLDGVPFKDGFKILTQKVRELGENVPPLFNAYMNLSPTLKTFGTSVNPSFGGVEETGIMVTVEDIFDAKYERYVGNKTAQ
jgi:hypothetical protein